MKIMKQAGFLHITFQEPDWNNPAGGAYEFIKEFKVSFVHATSENNGLGWSYDDVKKEWTVPDTETNALILESIAKTYLPPNENQTTLF
jgi:hypothetical protein